jgi:hypothetical protein
MYTYVFQYSKKSWKNFTHRKFNNIVINLIMKDFFLNLTWKEKVEKNLIRGIFYQLGSATPFPTFGLQEVCSIVSDRNLCYHSPNLSLPIYNTHLDFLGSPGWGRWPLQLDSVSSGPGPDVTGRPLNDSSFVGSMGHVCKTCYRIQFHEGDF